MISIITTSGEHGNVRGELDIPHFLILKTVKISKWSEYSAISRPGIQHHSCDGCRVSSPYFLITKVRKQQSRLRASSAMLSPAFSCRPVSWVTPGVYLSGAHRQGGENAGTSLHLQVQGRQACRRGARADGVQRLRQAIVSALFVLTSRGFIALALQRGAQERDWSASSWQRSPSSAAAKTCACVMAVSVRSRQSRIKRAKKGVPQVPFACTFTSCF